MDIFYRNLAPTYRGQQAQSTSSGTGPAFRIWCGVFGGNQPPIYRQPGGPAVSTRPVSGQWRVFPATPQYRTVSTEEPEECVLETPLPDCIEEDGAVVIAGDETYDW